MTRKKVTKTEEIKYKNEVEMQIAEAIRNGQPLTGKNGILTPIIKNALETALIGEINSHIENNEIANRKNGKAIKQIKSPYGAFELETPRDRNGTFEPEIVRKKQTVLTDELDQKIQKLFILGMSYYDIADNIKEIYGVDVHPSQITSITDRMIPIIKEWQSRPLESIYPIVFLDGMFHKVREDNRVTTKVLYNIIGINMEGKKEVIGTYVSETEGANFWLAVLTDLENRGVEDILIVCIDGLKGFPQAIGTIFPKTEIQLCIIHQIRNSLKYISYKNKKEFVKDLKLIYEAETQDYAESQLLYVAEKWEKKYPIVIKSWNENWEHLSTYFKYNKLIRKMIYTTNIIEGFHKVV